jgi:hypothetical protein
MLFGGFEIFFGFLFGFLVYGFLYGFLGFWFMGFVLSFRVLILGLSFIFFIFTKVGMKIFDKNMVNKK